METSGATVQRGAVNVEDLAAMQLFAELEPEERERVAALSEEIVVPEGETIDTQPNLAYEFFVTAEGRAEVVREGRRLAELGPATSSARSACSSREGEQPLWSPSHPCG